MDKLFIVMPAYNEQDNIIRVLDQWYPILKNKDKGSKLVIADFGSTDNTHKLLLNYKKSHPQLEILKNSEKLHGPKVIALYDYAIKHNADYVFQTDSDGQTNPEEFDYFWKNRKKYSAIFGNRTKRGDGKSRAYVEKVVCLLLKLIFNVTVPDANAPFRLIDVKVLKKYLYKIGPNYNLPNIMITTFFKYYGEKIHFKEISFKPRQAGTNSIDLKKIVKIGLKAIKDFRKFKKIMKNERNDS